MPGYVFVNLRDRDYIKYLEVSLYEIQSPDNYLYINQSWRQGHLPTGGVRLKLLDAQREANRFR